MISPQERISFIRQDLVQLMDEVGYRDLILSAILTMDSLSTLLTNERLRLKLDPERRENGKDGHVQNQP